MKRARKPPKHIWRGSFCCATQNSFVHKKFSITPFLSFKRDKMKSFKRSTWNSSTWKLFVKATTKMLHKDHKKQIKCEKYCFNVFYDCYAFYVCQDSLLSLWNFSWVKFFAQENGKFPAQKPERKCLRIPVNFELRLNLFARFWDFKTFGNSWKLNYEKEIGSQDNQPIKWN